MAICCDTEDNTNAFLEACSEAMDPIQCTKVEDGMVTLFGEYPTIRTHLEGDTFPLITVDTTTYDTSDAIHYVTFPVKFPNIASADCCDTDDNTGAFLEACSQAMSPVQCSKYIDSNVYLYGDVIAIEAYISSDAFPTITVDTTTYDTAGVTELLLILNYVPYDDSDDTCSADSGDLDVIGIDVLDECTSVKGGNMIWSCDPENSNILMYSIFADDTCSGAAVVESQLESGTCRGPDTSDPNTNGIYTWDTSICEFSMVFTTYDYADSDSTCSDSPTDTTKLGITALEECGVYFGSPGTWECDDTDSNLLHFHAYDVADDTCNGTSTSTMTFDHHICDGNRVDPTLHEKYEWDRTLCGYDIGTTVVSFPNINPMECCDSLDKINSFFQACSDAFYPVQCTTFDQSAVVLAGDMDIINGYIASDNFPAITVDTTTFDTSNSFELNVFIHDIYDSTDDTCSGDIQSTETNGFHVLDECFDWNGSPSIWECDHENPEMLILSVFSEDDCSGDPVSETELVNGVCGGSTDDPDAHEIYKWDTSICSFAMVVKVDEYDDVDCAAGTPSDDMTVGIRQLDECEGFSGWIWNCHDTNSNLLHLEQFSDDTCTTSEETISFDYGVCADGEILTWDRAICGYTIGVTVVKFPGIDVNVCCDTDENTDEFLVSCSEAMYPVECVTFENGAITLSGDMDVINAYIAGDNFPSITQDTNTYDTSQVVELMTFTINTYENLDSTCSGEIIDSVTTGIPGLQQCTTIAGQPVILECDSENPDVLKGTAYSTNDCSGTAIAEVEIEHGVCGSSSLYETYIWDKSICDSSAQKWGYPSDNTAWGGDCGTGMEQSPINLPDLSTAKTRGHEVVDYMNYQEVSLSCEDTGHALKWTAGATMGTLDFGSNPYELVQIHMHTASEHTYGDSETQPPLEIHLVHVDQTLSYAVVGVMCEVGTSSNDAFWDALASTMPDDHGVSTPENINWADLFAQIQTNIFFQYPGSFTTPPCTEGVLWTVMADICIVPQSFMDALGKYTSMADNYRATELLNARTIDDGAGDEVTSHSSWGYPSDNTEWGDICEDGREQSPVDLPTLDYAAVRAEEMDLRDVFLPINDAEVIGEDTGHSLKWSSAAGTPFGTLTLGNDTYNLVQMHIHTQSEHTVSEVRPDLEIHFVHMLDDGHDQYFAVVGVMCNAAASGPDFWTELQDAMPDDSGATTQQTISVDAFLDELNTLKYFQYDGSFTTPPCTEGVKWTVIADYCEVPQSFLDFVGTYQSMDGNYRNEQPLYGRTIDVGIHQGGDWYPEVQNPDVWIGECVDGMEQSPIALPREALIRQKSIREYIRYPYAVMAAGYDTGHALMWKSGGPMGFYVSQDTDYELQHWIIHMGSEHTFLDENNQEIQHELEIQFVHKSALNTYAILSMVCEETQSASFVDQNWWTGMMVSMDGTEFLFDLNTLFNTFSGTDLSKYYEYDGSFTTPDVECAEGVKWTVMAGLCHVPREFMDYTTKYLSMKDNFRRTQPLHGRTIYGGIETSAKTWGYPSDNVAWGGLCLSGENQSPVPLPEFSDAQAREDSIVDMIDYAEHTITGTNTGHTLSFYSDSGQAMGHFNVNGETFALAQIHIHTGSEHTYGGDDETRGAFEIQFLHVGAMGNPAIIALVCEEGDSTLNFWADLIAAMSIPTPTDPTELFESVATDKYFQYYGSLTSPPCTEGIIWNIVAETCTVPTSFLEFLQTDPYVDAMTDNYRELQSLRDRIIVVDDDGTLEQPWSYQNKENSDWGGTCESGTEQSPINLPELSDAADRQIHITELTTYESHAVTGTDTGKTLKWSEGTTAMGTIIIDGLTYSLLSLNLHAHSEHTYGSVEDYTDLEVQLIHAGQSGGHAILSILCDSGDPDDDSFWTALQDSMEDDQGVATATELDVNDLLESLEHTNRYWKYDGSFTKPGCNEGVKWIVMGDICKVPQSFLQFLAGYSTMNANYRKTQELNSREIDNGSDDAIVGHSSFGYPSDLDDSWGGDCATGSSQSPIDLDDVVQRPFEYSLKPKLVYNAATFYGKDISTALQWRTYENVGTYEVDENIYNLIQINMHTGSEHTIGTTQYELEIQFVHMYEENAVQYFAIVSLLCDEHESSKTNVWENLENAMDGSDTIDINEFFRFSNLERYTKYDGSHTTPPCYEGVKWTVVHDICHVPTSFLDFIGGYQSMENNWRTPQERGERSLDIGEDDVASVWGYPYNATQWAGKCGTGRQQSPIDLPGFSGTSTRDQYLTDHMTFTEDGKIFGINTGTALQWQGAVENAEMVNGEMEFTMHELGTFEMEAGKVFDFKLLDAHTESEHTVDGQQHDLELQFVFSKKKGSKQDTVIVSVLCDESEEDVAAADFFNGLEQAFDSSSVDIDFDRFFGLLHTKRYVEYKGSETHPPCHEHVHWIVVGDICKVPTSFLAFVSTFPELENNFRPVHDLNDREIEGYGTSGSKSVHIQFPNIVFNACCSTEGSTEAFLDACSQVVSPATCDSVTEGASVTAHATTVSIDGDVSQVEYFLDTNTFPAIGVGAISFDTTGATLIVVTVEDPIGNAVVISQEEEEEVSETKKKGVRIFITFFAAMVVIAVLVCVYLHYAADDDDEEEKNWQEKDEEEADTETLEMEPMKRGRSEVFLQQMYDPNSKSESAGVQKYKRSIDRVPTSAYGLTKTPTEHDI